MTQHSYIDDTIKQLAALVGFASVSRDSNLALIEYIEDILRKQDVAFTRLPSPCGRKANLLARIGPEVEGGIILSGHTDVVPIDGQEWGSPPFTLTQRGDKLYGRGTSDMKSFIALCLAFIPRFKALQLKRPIYFAFSYDEEVGCLGAPHLLEHITRQVPKPACVIIGEPTEMQVVTAHKGVLSYETIVSGYEWHSSQPHYGVNAIQVAADLIHFLMQLSSECQQKGLQDTRFDPPYSTVHVGVIQGGTARNIIPKECRFNWEIRPLPGDDADALFARFERYCSEQRSLIKQRHKEADIITRPVSRMLGVTLPPGSDRYKQLVMQCAQTNQEQAVAFGTEAGVFNAHHIPAIICGPGNIKQAHQPNEFIELSQLASGIDFMERLCEAMGQS
ncbi:MAG: acetylornithine deacetylase [Rickettsiales bacterium]|nr:acetylornithine deacetylase [Rickettsiales bacterium]